ncbi:Laminin subunit gamma-1 [Lamellibrachia satsuma]|nr:Laminin subunit gamma-1 [Lamellibrachia satsuma]
MNQNEGPCQCELAGSLNNHAECLPDSGICKCKEFVEGQNCDRCQPGYFAMSADNPQGCISCFCYGHSSVCSSAPGYTAKVIQSQFNTGRQRWKGIERGGKEIALDYNGVVQHIGISSLGIESSYFLAPEIEPSYFLAPARYLGNLKFSYDQVLSFSLRVGSESARASVLDVIIEGGNNQRISLPIFAQGNAIPRTVIKEYKFRLNEHPNYEWTPNLSSLEFIKLLSNVTALKIRGTYTPLSFGFIDNVKLGSAQPGRSAGGRAVSHVELCQCPQGYVGQFCESCAPGYHRDPPSGGPYARCVPCNCNGHSDTCDVNTGRCICQHNTVGLNCERCLPGYYGYALAGTANDCKVCPCPDNGECVEMINGEVACINCKEGYTGNRCEMCADGYYGDPQGKYGPPRPCQKCICNENIDPNAVANCNSTTGACLKCILNTAGFACAQCLPGYYGDALALPKGQCKACDCYDPGSQGDGLSSCAARSGQCPCLPNVAGLKCDQCWDGYWNIDSERGCERCGCDPVGSLNQTCDVSTGQCLCKPGVGGRTCDSCIEYYFGFSEEGCQMCSCDPAGSYTMQCDEVTGDCQCKTNIIGRRCDRCEENKYNISAGCIDCPICYNLVQDRVNIHRGKLHDLRELIHQINDNPKVVDDSDFRAKLDSTAATVDDLLEEARKTGGTDGTLADQLGALKAAIDDVISQCGDITMTTHQADGSSKNSIVDITAAEEAITAAEDALRNAHSHIEIDGIDALEKAKEAQGKYGQESTHMTEIAKEARALAERQEQEAERIEDTANLALNTSQEALRIAQESLHMPTYVADDLGRLQTDVFDAEQLFEGTRNLADKALQEADEAYKQSISLYTDADSVVVPEVDVDTLVSEAEDVKTEAAEIKEEADELREQQRTMMADVALQIKSAEETLTGGIRQQQVADELLADADAARAMARDAIAKAEKTLEDAKKALRTFREFDEKIRQSKFDAEDAIHRIPAIEDKIAEAEAKTYTARNNLADAEKDANMARDLAEEAQDIADMASDAAGNISNEAAETKLRAVQLNDEAEQLSNDVDGATLNLEKYEQQAEEDARLVQEALEKADEAKTGAVDSSQRVKTALNTVDDILSQLSNLDSIDTDMLSELELNLYDAEQTIVDANIETKYNDMLASRHQQNIWVRDYTDELIQLRKDVENIRQINDSIPLGCYKSIKLEPVG